MNRSLIDRLIYLITQKPRYYVEVKYPPKTAKEKLLRPQDARQMQYNRWSKHFKVYSRAYLPENVEELTSKGWKKKKISDAKHDFYQCSSTHQTIRYDRDYNDKKGKFIKGHYHWSIWWKDYFGKKTEEKLRKKQYRNRGTEKVYYNKYGEKTSFSNPDHHIFS